MENLTSGYRINLLIKYGKNFIKSSQLGGTPVYPKNLYFSTKRFQVSTRYSEIM